jgi:hypothetical protein
MHKPFTSYDFADRLRDEAVAHKACIMFLPMTGAWTRLPQVRHQTSTRRLIGNSRHSYRPR